LNLTFFLYLLKYCNNL